MFAQPATHLVSFALVVAGGLSAQDPSERPSRLSSPVDALEAVRDAFNTAVGKPRFVAVLSPT